MFESGLLKSYGVVSILSKISVVVGISDSDNSKKSLCVSTLICFRYTVVVSLVSVESVSLISKYKLPPSAIRKRCIEIKVGSHYEIKERQRAKRAAVNRCSVVITVR